MKVVTEGMGKAIINAYSMNCWSDNGNYCYEDSDLNCWTGISTTDECIYIENFKEFRTCKDWLFGRVSLLDLVEDKQGVYREREEDKK